MVRRGPSERSEHSKKKIYFLEAPHIGLCGLATAGWIVSTITRQQHTVMHDITRDNSSAGVIEDDISPSSAGLVEDEISSVFSCFCVIIVMIERQLRCPMTSSSYFIFDEVS